MSINLRFLISAICLVLSFQLQSQRVIPDEQVLDYSCENKPLRQVLFDLSEKANVTIAWQDQIIPADSIVSLSIRNQRLGKIIDFLIVDHELKYKIVGNQISIVKDPFKKDKDEVTISGYLLDQESGEALVSANIYLQDKSLGTVTNEYGFYSFTVPKGKHRIYFSYLGYDNGIEEVLADKDMEYNVELIPSNFLKEIIITETKLTPIPLNEPEISSANVLPIGQLKAKLPLAGEPDVMRMALSMPGVTSGSDGFGGMSVRGGATNQNLVLFDGVPIYNSEHAFGLFSIFNSRVIKSAKLYKGAFPAHYSGRLSSVIDIRTREGNYRKFGGEVSVGLLTGSVALEGPIVKDKASFLFSARRTLVDPWLKAVSKEYNKGQGNEGQTDFYFYDINGKVNFNLGKHSKIYFSYYTGDDFFENDVTSNESIGSALTMDRDQVNWRIESSLASMRLNSRLSQKSFLNLTLYQSSNNFNAFDHDRFVRIPEMSNDSIVSYEAGYYQSKIEDLGAKLELDYIPNTKHRFKLGGGYIKHDFTPGLIVVNHTDSLTVGSAPITSGILENQLDDANLVGHELEFFVEDQIRLGKFSSLNIGYNHMVVSAGGQTYNISQPRILFSAGSENFMFKASGGRMGQFLHSLNNTGLGVPIDVWLPSTAKIAPEISWNFTTGAFIQKDDFGQFGAEVFYKKYEGLTRYSSEGLIDISSESNWEELIPIGEGESYGAEFSIEKTKGKALINASYTLSFSNRTFEELNDGEPFRFRYDRRHVINLGMIYALSNNIDFTMNWEYGSGTPITVPTGQRFVEENEVTGNPILILIYDQLSNALLPDYHRLDLGFNMKTEYTWGKTVFTLGLYNVYNRQNPFFRDINIDFNTEKVTYEDVTILPILPTVSYTVSF